MEQTLNDEIDELRRELSNCQRRLGFYNRQRRKYRTHSPELSRLHKLMASETVKHIRYLKQHVKKLAGIQEQIIGLGKKTNKISEHKNRVR
jgi:predicted RNase H-like nuclease (RuvC/YqgF family)